MTTLLAALAVAAGAVTQSVTGLGFSLVCAPFLVALAGPRDGVRINLLLSAVINLAYLLPERRQARVGDALRLLGPAAVATALTAWLTRGIDTDPLAVAAGVTTVAAAVALLANVRVRQPHVVIAGGLSGMMNTIAGIGGPAVAVYAVGAGWPATVRRSTFQLYFLGLNIVGLIALGVRWPPALLWLGLVAGFGVGRLTIGRLSEDTARTATLLIALAGGLVAIGRGLM